ncbi:amidase [Maritimibacter alkaliphilus]|uniref:amidase n=1 Tax=Maritimibacter alkaliphilus TaxID=404236 RepID=UPI001C97CBE3|nr:amidase [Maritimibacter alkaliphilus]MBY6089286.1 amidase [Maritimibacter alkaliphilus]
MTQTLSDRAEARSAGYADATALAQAIAAGEITQADAMQRARARAEEVANLGAVCWLAEGDPAEVNAQPGSGTGSAIGAAPFAGVPLLVKDLGGPFAGIPMRAGSKALARMKGASDSDLAQRFRAAGFRPFGATTVPEFGLSLSSEPAIGPRCRNPLDPSRTAGGSSGGAAAAVAAGIVPLAHATDAAGSIRVPAACCGLIGLKPSRGAIPGGPGFGNHLGGIATEFALTRTIRDAQALFPCLTGQSRGPAPDPAQLPEGTALTIGLVTGAEGIAPERAAAVEAAAGTLAQAGHRIEEVPVSDLAQIMKISARAFDRIASANLAGLVQAGLDPALFEPLTRAFVARGQALSAADLYRAQEGIATAAHLLWRLFDRVDVLLTPMLASAPVPLGSFPTDHDDPQAQLDRMAAFAPFTAMANVTGAPALTLPVGADAEGLPLPVHLIAPMGGDLRLLALGRLLEGGWTHPIPLFGGAA